MNRVETNSQFGEATESHNHDTEYIMVWNRIHKPIVPIWYIVVWSGERTVELRSLIAQALPAIMLLLSPIAHTFRQYAKRQLLYEH